MWISYDMTGSLKPETSHATIQRSQEERSVRDVLVGYSYAIHHPGLGDRYPGRGCEGHLKVVLDGMPAEIACYGDGCRAS